MKTYELLDRFELLYPTNTKLADLRRIYIDQDLTSIFRLMPDEYEELRKAVVEQNLHSIFRLTNGDEELRKAVLEQNLHSIFRLTNGDEELRKAVLEQNLHSIFRLTNGDEELRKAVLEQNLHSIFRLVDGEVNGKLEELRKAVLEQNLHSIFRLLPDEHEELRKAIVEQNLHSIFRLLPDEHEELRKAIVEQNLHSIFRLVDDEDLRKLVLEDNIWKLWPILDRYVDTQFVAAFKNFFVNETKIWDDCFSRGQIKSKLWIIKELTKLNLDLGTVFLCAGWYATLATMLFESKIKVSKIRSFDNDPSCAKIAEVFNKPWFEDDWRFKASTVDIMDFEWTDVPAPSDGTLGNFYYMTSGTDKPIQMKDNPDTIINTSCEHIANFDEWYNNIPDGKLVILQSNDYFEIEEHVNCHKSISQFSKSTPMNETLFEGELFLPDYTRFMKIGYK